MSRQNCLLSRQSSFVSLQLCMLRHKLYCRDIASLLSALIVVATESRIIVTDFFTIFFNNVVIEKLFVATKFLFQPMSYV